jgi:hypothetical protein
VIKEVVIKTTRSKYMIKNPIHKIVGTIMLVLSLGLANAAFAHHGYYYGRCCGGGGFGLFLGFGGFPFYDGGYYNPGYSYYPASYYPYYGQPYYRCGWVRGHREGPYWIRGHRVCWY